MNLFNPEKHNVKHTIVLCMSALLSGIAHSESRPAMLEEIVITAEHREASVQETKISMSAFSADAMAEMGINNMGDLSNFAPNLTISEQANGRGGFAINIRGIRQGESLISFDPAVGMYIDGVLIAKNVGALLDAIDPERIEVLRGPQGTLYGRNTIGGAVNIITRKPSDDLSGKLAVTLGSEQQRDFKGTLNLPLFSSDSKLGAVNLRASLASLNRDGFYTNQYPGAPNRELDTVDREIALVHLQWQPSDRANVLYSYDRTEVEDIPSPWFVTSVDEDSNAIAPRLLKDYIFTTGQDDRPDAGQWNWHWATESEVEGHALNFTFDLSDSLALSSITSQREMNNFGQGDSDGSPFTLLQTLGDQQEDTIFSQELRLIGSAFDDKLDFVAGAFYMNEDGAMTVGSMLDLAVARALPVLTNTLIHAQNNIDFENDIWALYGQATYRQGDKWDVSLGLRYTEEDRTMDKNVVTFVNGNPVAQDIFPSASGTFDNLSGMLSAGYNITEDAMAYGKISQGYQSGGFNSRDREYFDFVRGFDEETVLAYEVGLKSFFDNQRYMLNAAMFFNDYEDKVVSKIVIDDQGVRNVLRNAGVVEIYGAEIEFRAQFDSGLQLGVDYGYTHPEYKEYQDDLGNDLTDSEFQFTPRNNVHAYVSYDFPQVTFARLSGRIDWSYQGDHHFTSAPDESNSSDGYELVNGRLTLSELAGPASSLVRVSLWGKNLLDEEYWSNGVDLFQQGFGFAINGYGDPRTFGVDISVEL